MVLKESALAWAIEHSEKEIALVKQNPKAEKHGVRMPDEQVEQRLFGFAAAVDERKARMEGVGFQTALPNLTKEQKKIEKEKKKALTSAKHLMR